jgi:hypothetical protein
MHWLSFFITESYKHTLALLEKLGMDDLFCGISHLDIENGINIQAQYHMALPHRTVELYYTGELIHENDTRNNIWMVKGIPKEDYPNIIENARTHYFGAGGGYRLYITWSENGELKRTRLFLPEADATPYLKEAVRKINYNRP